MAPSSSITMSQKLDILVGFSQSLFGTLFTIFGAPFRGANTPNTLTCHILLSLCRRVLERLSPEQIQYIAGTTESNYLAWTKAHGLAPSSVFIPNIESKAFWIGDAAAEYTVIYYHGGGFAMPASDGHFSFVSSMITEAGKAGKSVAALVLQYDLAPGRQYPRQLTQAVELLRYVVNELGKDPGQVMLMGDSAGGNMIFGVLSHLLHPHPSIQPLQISKPLKASFISSPVTVLNTNSQKFQTNEGQDPASAKTIQLWLRNLLGSKSPDAWNEPLGNDAEWWIGFEGVVSEVLITVAANEMMVDDTSALCTTIQTVYAHLTLFSSKTDFHAAPAIGPSLGMSLGEAAQVLISWIIERC